MKCNNCNKHLLSICDISPIRFGSFEEFLVALTIKLNKEGYEHTIVFREKPIKRVEDAFLNLNVDIKILRPSKCVFSRFIQISKLITKVRPNIVHFHFYPIYSIINYLPFFFNITIVYTDHMGGGLKQKFLIRRLLRRIYYYLYSKLFGFGIAKIICVSEFVKSKYPSEYGIKPVKMCVIYNGINVDRFRKKPNELNKNGKYDFNNQLVITSVGLRYDKGPHYLIKAAPLILQKVPNAIFVLVGDGECKSYLEKLIEDEKIKDHVVILGVLEDMTDLYNISSCVVVPSLCEEAFCFVAAEAMATEIPVVAFNSGAIKEVVFDRSQLVERDYTLLSNKLSEVLMNTNFNHKLLRDHIVNNFHLKKCIEQYFYLYESLIDNK